MTAARRCSGVLYLSTCVLLLLVAVHTRQSAALNPYPVTNWRCSSTLPDNYIYFGAGSTSNFGNFCTIALGPTAAEPTPADYASPCLSAYARDIALDQYDTAEFATAGGVCYPNRTGACTPTTNAVYICKAPPLTTIQIGLPQCPLLTTDNGLWEYPSGLLYPSWARLVCNIGYKLSSPASWFTISQQNSLWNLAAFNPNCTVVTCPASQSIANGNLQISAMTYNSMATLLCTGPTTLAGSNASVCQNDGTWSVPNGRCIAKAGILTCATALAIANGHLLITSTTVNATATLVCDNGYVLIGSGSSTCQGGGSWSTPSGACQRTCPQYQTVSNGLLSISANTDGSTATTVCNANYVLVGSSGSETCQSSGIWTTTGTCQQRCTPFPTILNGGFLCRSDGPGSTTTVACNAGYVVSSGSTTSTCTAGSWTSVTATCQKRCTMLPTITNGGFLYTTDNPGSTATAICNTGYILTGGTGTSTCTSGTWNAPSGTCQKRCTTLPTITNGGFLYTTDISGSKATVVCNTSYTLTGGTGASTCTSGTWTTPSGTCQIRCTTLPTITNGGFLYTTDISGSTATVVCNTGYTLTGGAGTSACSSGTWSTPIGTCQRVCPPTQLVTNGILKMSSIAVNAVATTQCDSGYVLVGNGNATCQAVGAWSSTSGSCLARCTSAPTINNGSFLYTAGIPGNPSSTATAVCNTGYTLTGGSGTSTCTTGSWTTPTGTCQRTCPEYQTVNNGLLAITSTAVNSAAAIVCHANNVLVGDGTVTCQSSGAWSTPVGACQARCTTVLTILNGRLLFGSDSPASTATVVCDTGYTLTGGVGTSTCTAGGWTTPAGTCQRTCPQKQPITNGVLSITNNAVSSTATTVCNANHVLVGNGSATCQADGTWSTPTGNCQTRCISVLTISNGSLLYTSDNPGSTATVACNSGYTLQGGSVTSRCLAGTWTRPVGTCQKRCTAMPTISNGRLLYGSDNPGSQATLICNTGYTLTGGAGTSTCLSGLWTSPAGMCERVCPLSQSVTNGLLAIINNTVSETAYTVCNAGHVLVMGNGEATCEMNGQWSTTTGQCQARCTSVPTISNGSFVYSSDSPGSTATVLCNTGYALTSGAGTSTCTGGSWTSTAASCQTNVVKCPSFQRVSNGILSITATDVNSVATTVCINRYVLVRNGSATCQSSGTWSTPTGACQARCTSAPNITNGGLLYTTGNLGNPASTATVVCNTGYTFTGGSRTSICSNGTWTTPSGICERTCPQYQTVSNGLLSITGNAVVNSAATTVCIADFVLVGDGMATCQSSGTWSTPAGTCQATTGSSGASSCNWISETPSFAVIAAIAVLVIALIVLLIICLRRGRRYGANIEAEAMTDLGPIKRTSSIGLPLAVNGNYEENDGGVTLENARVSQFYATTGPRTAKQTTTFRGGQDDDTYAVAQPSVPTKNFVAGDDTYDVMQRGESVRAPAAPAAPPEEGATYDVLQRGESVRFPPPPPALEDNYDILQRGDGTPILSAKSADPDAMYNTIQHPVPEPSVDVGANEYDTVTGTKPRPPAQPKPSPSAKPRTPYVNAPSPMAT